MCQKVVEIDPWHLKYVPYHFKTQEMCDDVVGRDPYYLAGMADWFVTQKQLKLWHDDDDDDDDCNDEMIEWYNGYQKRKAQKASIKEELMSVAWHPPRCWDWCVPEDEKRGTEKIFIIFIFL